MTSYSRDATVQALRALYETVMLMGNVPASTLSTPPPSWSPPARTRKSDTVIDLMAHLPYNNDVHLAHETSPINYMAPNWMDGRYVPFKPYGDRDDSEANIPVDQGGGVADVTEDEIVLTMQNDSIGQILVLDTTTGGLMDVATCKASANNSFS